MGEKRLRNQIKYLTEENEEKQSKIRDHSEAAEKKLRFCIKQSEQTRTVDEAQVTITYSHNLPTNVYSYSKNALGLLKAALFQYISEISQPTQNNKIQINLNFNSQITTVDVKGQTPEENV